MLKQAAMEFKNKFAGKRERLARALLRSGITSLLSQIPDRDSLLVLTYHRIGNADKDLFDPGLFSASSEEFDEQISHLKRNASLDTLEEALCIYLLAPAQNEPLALPCVDHVRRRLSATTTRLRFPFCARMGCKASSFGHRADGWVVCCSMVGQNRVADEDRARAQVHASVSRRTRDRH